MYCHILWALYQASQKPGFRTQTVKKKRLCEEWFKIKVIIFGGVILLKNCNLSIIHIHVYPWDDLYLLLFLHFYCTRSVNSYLPISLGSLEVPLLLALLVLDLVANELFSYASGQTCSSRRYVNDSTDAPWITV